MRRIVTAVVLLPILWVVIKLAPLWVFLLFAGVVIAIATWECYGLLAGRGARPFKLLGLLACLALAWSFIGFEPCVGAGVPVVVVVVVAAVAAMWTREDPAAMLDAVLTTLFPVVFVGLGLGYGVALRAFPGPDGEDLLMLLFACVIATDTGAYYVGTLLGRHRLAPRISPKKSWEGAAGGLVASVVAALIAQAWFFQRLSVGHAIAVGVSLALAAILGDLAESMVKRAAGAKDASSLLPGHGGMLDRVDGVLFAAPVLYHYYVLFL